MTIHHQGTLSVQTLGDWLVQNEPDDILRIYSSIYELTYAQRVRSWFERLTDHHGAMLLVSHETGIIGISDWSLPTPETMLEGTIFGDMGTRRDLTLPSMLMQQAKRLLAQTTAEQIQLAVDRRERHDLYTVRMHVRVDDVGLIKACRLCGFKTASILANRFEDLGSFVKTRMVDLDLNDPS